MRKPDLSPSLQGRTLLCAGEEAQARPGPGACRPGGGAVAWTGLCLGAWQGELRCRCALRLPGEQKAPHTAPWCLFLLYGLGPPPLWPGTQASPVGPSPGDPDRLQLNHVALPFQTRGSGAVFWTCSLRGQGISQSESLCCPQAVPGQRSKFNRPLFPPKRMAQKGKAGGASRL